MLPKQYVDISERDFEFEENESSKTYKMHLNSLTIVGKTDSLEAMLQVVYKILNTERYENSVYSFNYGISLIDLYGEDPSWICPELKARIIEALTQDTRISDVDSFDFKVENNKIFVKFTVHTIYGDINTDKVVNY